MVVRTTLYTNDKFDSSATGRWLACRSPIATGHRGDALSPKKKRALRENWQTCRDRRCSASSAFKKSYCQVFPFRAPTPSPPCGRALIEYTVLWVSLWVPMTQRPAPRCRQHAHCLFPVHHAFWRPNFVCLSIPNRHSPWRSDEGKVPRLPRRFKDR